MKPRRQLSDLEIAMLLAVHAGVDPARYLAMVEPELTVSDDGDEFTMARPMLKYKHKLRFLLNVATYPNTH